MTRRASRDEQNFAKLVKLMGFDAPDVYIIPAKEPIPGFQVQHKVSKLVEKAAPGRSVLFIHYYGPE